MSSIDDRIVRMQLNNSAFERAAGITLGTLSKLKQSLSFGGDKKNGLDDLQNSARKFSLSSVTDQIGKATRQWSAWRTAGLIAFATVVHQAVRAGERVLASFTIDPIKAGFQNYETQINAVQTILANTGLKGKKGLGQVNAALAELNTYANKTVYNFSEMARNIGTFTAAGVNLKVSTASIKGIANLAALSGSNSEQASTAMYQLSQAIASNQVKLQDWNSVVNAGLGGKVFQQALFNTGKALHTIKGVGMNETFDQWTKSGNSFRGSLQKGWITGKVLTQTLQGFTGDLTDAQLKSMGYNAQQIKQIREMGKTANDAATKIKTFSQLTQALKEEVATAYGAVFKTIFGDINQSTAVFSKVHTVVENGLTQPIYKFNKLLQGWSSLGGRTALIDGLTKAFHALSAVFKPIHEAFQEIFPPTTARQLADMTKRFDDFMGRLKIGDQTAANLKRTFAGVFALFDIGKQVIVGLFHMFGTLLGAITQGSGGFLNLTGSIGDFLVSLDQALKSGGGLQRFFQKFGNVIAIPLSLMAAARHAIMGLFDGWSQKDATDIEDAFGRIGDRISSLTNVGKNIKNFFANLWQNIQPGVQALQKSFGGIGTAIASAFKSGNFSQVFDALNTGLLAGIALVVRKFFKSGININVGEGLFGSLKEVFEGLTGNLHAMQQQVKAKTLLEIASAVGILALSAVALAAVDSKKLTGAMKALAVGFGELLAAMSILSKISGTAGLLKVPVIAASMNLLATSILILTVAVSRLSKLSWQQLQKGLTAVGILLAAISATSLVLSRNSAGLIRASIAIGAIGVAMNILYFAVKDFAKLDWGQLLKGLTSVTVLLAGIAGAARLMPPNMPAIGAGLLIISTSLLIMYKAVASFSSLDWGQLLKGLAGVAGSLLAVAGAMHLMPTGMVAQAAGLVVVGAALNIIAKAVGTMASMSWQQIGKGLTTLAGSMIILVGALNILDGALSGAAALLVVSAALRIFTPVLITLSKLSWGDLLHGLVGLAAAFAVIGVAGFLLAPLTPALLGLGVALGLIGAAFTLFGVGALATATAFSILAKAGVGGVKILLDALEGVVKMFPTIGKNLALGLVNFVVVIAKNAPAVVGALIKLLGQLLDGVAQLAPKMAKAITAVIAAFLTAIRNTFPDIVKTGLKMLLELLDGIRNNIGKITKVVIDIIVKFINTVANNIGRIIKAGLNLLEKFLVGIANGLGKIPGIVLKVIGAFLSSLFGGLGKIAAGGLKMLVRFVGGILGGLGKVAAAGAKVLGKVITALAGGAASLAKKGWNAVSHFIGGIINGMKDLATKVFNAAAGIGKAIVHGIGSFLNIDNGLSDQLKSMVNNAVNVAKKALKIHSPSRVFMEIGKFMMLGWQVGVDDHSNKVVNSTEQASKNVISSMSKSLSSLSDVLSSSIDTDPVVRPVMDLTQIRKDAAQLTGLVSTTPITPVLSTSQAKSISSTTTAKAVAEEATSSASTGPVASIELKQYNTSPKALSTLDIYRQTKNQLALAKKALGVPT